MKRLFCAITGLILFVAATSAPNVAQATIIDVGPHERTYIGMTRGFYFTAPIDFIITGLGVPTDASTDNFDVAVLLLHETPPPYSAETNNFDTLFLSRNNPGTGLLSVDINVSAGSIIGILGSRGGDGDSSNSYGPNPYLSNIFGNPVQLDRLLMQSNLRDSDPFDIGVSGESGAGIGRVWVDIAPIPEPSTLLLLGTGLLGVLVYSRRRKRVE